MTNNMLDTPINTRMTYSQNLDSKPPFLLTWWTPPISATDWDIQKFIEISNASNNSQDRSQTS